MSQSASPNSPTQRYPLRTGLFDPRFFDFANGCRVDRIEQILPETVALEKSKVEDGDATPEIARSVSLAADDLGLIGSNSTSDSDLGICHPPQTLGLAPAEMLVYRLHPGG